LPYLQEAGLIGKELPAAEKEWLTTAVELLLEGSNKFSELPQKFSLIFDFKPESLEEEAAAIISSDSARKVLKALVEKTAGLTEFNYDLFARITGEIKKETGIKGKELYHPLRVMLTARASGLELDKFIPLIEAGAKLNFPRPVKSSLQRITEFARLINLEPERQPA